MTCQSYRGPKGPFSSHSNAYLHENNVKSCNKSNYLTLPHSPNSQNGTLPPPPTHPFTSMACRLSIKLGDDTTKVDSHAIQNITRIVNAASIVRSIWLSWIKVLNCLKCQHVHKSSQSSQSCHLCTPTTSMEVADLYYTLCNLSRRPSTIEMHHWLHLQSFTPASFFFYKTFLTTKELVITFV